jgi:excisionase family DNA binding protein
MSIDLVTAKQAAEMIGLSLSAVYDLLKGGGLPHLRVGLKRRTIRIRRVDVERYLERAEAKVFQSSPPPRKRPIARSLADLEGFELMRAAGYKG